MTKTTGVNDPITLVQNFLRLMEKRDLPAASRLVNDDITITFPGGRTFTSLEQQVESSGGRFQSVTKTFERFDVCEDPASSDGGAAQVIVYVFGTLSGERLDRSPFAGVRFIDRFVIDNGLIADQRVWNDVAESGILLS